MTLLLVSPTVFVSTGGGSLCPWAFLAGAVAAGTAFVARARRIKHPIVDLALVARALVSSGLLYKAATGLASAGLSYFVTLQLQLAWGWSPVWAAIGMLPQVVVLLAGGMITAPIVRRLGLDRVAWLSAAAVVAGLAIFALAGRCGYLFVALSLVLVSLGIRLNGVVAGTNVMRGMPANRTTLGASLVDTSSELATGVGVAVAGTALAALFTGSLAASAWSPLQRSQFETATLVGGVLLTLVAAALVGWGYARSRVAQVEVEPAPATTG